MKSESAFYKKLTLFSTVTLLIIILLPSVFSVATNTDIIYFNQGSENIDNQEKDINIGLNYLSLYHMYSSEYTTDEILHRDFSRFQNDGINVISLSLYWYRLEGNSRGDYDGEYLYTIDGINGYYGERYLDDIKRVIKIANDYNVKIMITIHTVWGTESDWCIPDYVIDPVSGEQDCFAIVRSEEMKQSFIEMFTHTINYLANTPNICAWAILNEPWYYHHMDVPRGNLTQKENFVDLIQKLSAIVKSLDDRPVTIRFVNGHNSIDSEGAPKIKNIFTYDWNMDPRIFEAIDFVCLNDYMPAYPEIYNDWKNITINNVDASIELGKKVWITECGFPPSRFDFVEGANNDETQTSEYKKFTEFYKTLAIDAVMAWYWRSDNSIPNPGTIGMGRNLCADSTGEPRPAYYELTNK